MYSYSAEFIAALRKADAIDFEFHRRIRTFCPGLASRFTNFGPSPCRTPPTLLQVESAAPAGHRGDRSVRCGGPEVCAGGPVGRGGSIPPLQQRPAAGPTGQKDYVFMIDFAPSHSSATAASLRFATPRRASTTDRPSLSSAPRRATGERGPNGVFYAQAHAYRCQSPGGDPRRRTRRPEGRRI